MTSMSETRLILVRPFGVVDEPPVQPWVPPDRQGDVNCLLGLGGRPVRALTRQDCCGQQDRARDVDSFILFCSLEFPALFIGLVVKRCREHRYE